MVGLYPPSAFTMPKGTGKYEGIKGGATWRSYSVAPKQSYMGHEWNVELHCE